MGQRVEKDDMEQGEHDWLGNDYEGLVSLAWWGRGLKAWAFQPKASMSPRLPPASHLSTTTTTEI